MLDENPMHWRLTIGELFPAEDLVGQWVFTLTCAAQDIEIAGIPLRNRQGEEARVLAFFYRVLIARIYESRRLIQAYNAHAEIREFVGSALSVAGIDLVALYTRPGENVKSEVERLYDQSRHRSVHYPKVGSSELRGLLNDYRRFPANLKLDAAATPPTIDAQWVSVIRSQDVWGAAPWEPGFLEGMKELSTLTGQITAAWTMANGVLLIKYVRDRGISFERLTQGNERDTDEG